MNKKRKSQKSRKLTLRKQKSRKQKSRKQKCIKTEKKNVKQFMGGSTMVHNVVTAMAGAGAMAGVGFGLLQRHKLQHLRTNLSAITEAERTSSINEKNDVSMKLEQDVANREHISRLLNELRDAELRSKSMITNAVEKLSLIIQPKNQLKSEDITFTMEDYTKFSALPDVCSSDKVSNLSIRALRNDQKLKEFLTTNHRNSPPMLLSVACHGRIVTKKKNTNDMKVQTFIVPHNISLTIIYLTKFGLINMIATNADNTPYTLNHILNLLDDLLKTKSNLTTFTLMQITKSIFTQSNKFNIDRKLCDSNRPVQCNQYHQFNTSPVVVTFLPGEQVINKDLDSLRDIPNNFAWNIVL